MALQLYFIPSKFSRATTRDEWKEIWRWKRLTEQKLRADLEKERALISNLGTPLAPHIKEALLDHMINPPLLVHDKQEWL